MAITRREFIKYSTISGIGIIGMFNGLPLLGALKESTNGTASVAKWMTTVCQGCTTWCPVQVKMIDGRAVKVRGSEYAKANHGKCCVRAHMGIQQLYDPDRLKVPMMRTNPKKGRNEDPGFVPITWEKAIDIITDKMMELRKNEETHKFVLFRGRYTYMRDIIYEVMPKVFGSPNGISHSAICAEAEKFGSFFTEGYWGYRDYDLDKTRYVLCWGADPIASNRQVPHATSIWGKVQRQAKIAVIDPRLSTTAAKANEWLPVIPGEDGALAVAMAHTILVEGLWSKLFVGDFKDGENLFKKGNSVPEESFVENYTYGLVKWWNLELKDKTPEWAEKKSGIPAEQIRRVAIGFADAAPRVISWVSPGTAMQVRGGYSALAAHALNGLVGSVDNVGGTVRGSKIPVNKVPKYKEYYDDIAKAGTKHKKMDQRGYLKFPALKKGKPGSGVVTNNAADAILNEDPYEIKMAIGYWNNFPFSCSGAERWEKALSKLPFFAHITTHASEMSHFADIVLPAAHSMFEKYGFIKSKQNLIAYVALNKRIIEPLWDVKMDETEIPWEIAAKLKEKGFPNLMDCFQDKFKDPETGKVPQNGLEFSLFALKYYTQPIWDKNHEKYGKYGDAPDGWDDFYEKGVWNSKKYKYRQNWGKFGTVTKKFEFYSETLKKSLGKHADKHGVSIDTVLEKCDYVARGEVAFVPHYEPAFRRGDPREYPFIFFEHRSRLNREGRSANLTWYQAHKDSDPGDENWDDVAKINPIDAKKIGINNGDKIKLISPVGELQCNAKLWEGVRPGTVAKCFGQGHWAYGRIAAKDFKNRIPRGGNNNVILPAEYDRLSGSTARHGGVTRVKIEKIV
ncbi:MAG: molybdopterin-dependent oxidoreductase [Candidatus Marinimicrobia bacterium]|nr:molybdopterin-dependent oxidoreductase [Candidatus Neomarinimicrobiota bacterium]